MPTQWTSSEPDDFKPGMKAVMIDPTQQDEPGEAFTYSVDGGKNYNLGLVRIAKGYGVPGTILKINKYTCMCGFKPDQDSGLIFEVHVSGLLTYQECLEQGIQVWDVEHNRPMETPKPKSPYDLLKTPGIVTPKTQLVDGQPLDPARAHALYPDPTKIPKYYQIHQMQYRGYDWPQSLSYEEIWSAFSINTIEGMVQLTLNLRGKDGKMRTTNLEMVKADLNCVMAAHREWINRSRAAGGEYQ